MRKLLLFIPCILLGQTLKQQAVGPSSAIYRVEGANGSPCTISLIDKATGANVGSSTIQTAPSSMITLVLGGTFPLRNFTSHDLTVSVCIASPLVDHFQTSSWGPGSIYPFKIPVGGSGYGNRTQQSLDLINGGLSIDPVLGATIKAVANTKWINWQSGGSAGAIASGAALAASDFVDGASAWTNATRVGNGSVSNFGQVSSTNPIDLYYDISAAYVAGNGAGGREPFRGVQSISDFGLIPFAVGDTASHTAFTVCTGFVPANGCVGTPFTVTPLASGGVARVNGSGSSADPDHSFPTSYPGPLWSGWGNPGIKRENLSTYPTGVVVDGAGKATIATVTGQNFFQDTVATGQRINCGGTLGTVVSNENAGQIHISGIAAGTYNCTVYGWFIRVQKADATGTLSVGVQLKLAGSYASYVAALGNNFQQVPISANGVTGYLGAVTFDANPNGIVGWFGNDGTTFPVTAMKPHAVSGMAVDQPSGSIGQVALPGWDYSTGGVMYASARNSSSPAGNSVFKIDCTANFAGAYSGYDDNYGADAQGNFPASPADGCTWSNLMKPSAGLDLQTQMAAFDSKWAAMGQYNNLYGAWDSTNNNVYFAGTTGCLGGRTYGIYVMPMASLNTSPAFLVSVDLSTGLVSRVMDTLRGTGFVGGALRNGKLHAVESVTFPCNTISVGANGLDVQSTSFIHGGYFSFGGITVERSAGVFNSTMTLPWPIDNTYFNTCPGGIAAQWVALGASGNQCTTWRVNKGGPANFFATTAEKAAYPPLWCSGGTNYSQPFTVYEGMLFIDGSLGNRQAEEFRVVKINEIDSCTTELVIQRNATWDYCYATPGTHVGGIGFDGSSIAVHGSSWVPWVGSGQNNSCFLSAVLVDVTTGISQEMSFVINAAHSTVGHGIYSDSTNALISGVGVQNEAVLGTLPTVYNALAPIASCISQGFNGISLGCLGQSYPHRGQNTAGPLYGDGNGLLGSFGNPPETDQNSITTRSIAQVSGDVYLIGCVTDGITLANSTTYKTIGMYGWAGRYTLGMIDGPSSNIAAAPDMSGCYAYKAGECSGGSSANTCYTKVSHTLPTTSAFVAQSFMNSPVMTPAMPGVGQWRTGDTRSQDLTGVGSQQLSYGLCGPGYWYTYGFGAVHPSGLWMFAPGNCIMQGFGQTGLMIPIPTFSGSSLAHNGFQQTSVTLGSGSAYRRIEFGYNPSLYCLSGRSEVCITDPAYAPLYAFRDTDSGLTPLNSCTSGCTIKVPLIADIPVWMQIQESTDGVTWSNQGEVVQFMAQ